MRILALDISKSSTGMAIGDGLSPPRTAAMTFPGKTRGAVYLGFFRWLQDIIAAEAPQLIAFEAALLYANEKGSADVARLLLGFGAVLELVATGRGIEHHDIAIPTWRKKFLGSGYPDDPKGEALRMCRLLGWETGELHDRAEAAGVWAAAHLTYGDARAMRTLLSGAAVRRMEATR